MSNLAEKKATTTSTELLDISGTDMVGALEIASRMLNLPESGRLRMLSIGMQDYPNFVKALPPYGIDKPVIDDNVEVPTSGSSGATASMSYHLNDLNVGKSVRTVNMLLTKAGLLEQKETVSSDGSLKYFNALTKKGLKYGKNIGRIKCPRETYPHYYISMIGELLAKIA